MRVSSLPKAVTWKWNGRNLNPRPFGSRANALPLSSHSTTPTPTSSRGSSQECRRVVQLAAGITSGNRASDVSARILAMMSVSVSVSASWNSSFKPHRPHFLLYCMQIIQSAPKKSRSTLKRYFFLSFGVGKINI